MKSFAVLSAALALVQVAVAQSGATIPDGISSQCSTFLTAFDSNADIKAAVGPLNDALKAFSSDKYASASQQDMQSALSDVCSGSFPESAFKKQLTDFVTACEDELNGGSPNEDVQEIYDRVYTLPALHRALCAKDDKNNFCAAEFPAGSSSQVSLGNTADPDAAVSSMFDGTDLAFLFIDPSASKDTLCVPCTRSILLSYSSWEASISYARGLAQSDILGGQKDLWSHVTSTCGNDFFKATGSGPVNVGGSLGMGTANANGAGSLRVPSIAFGALAVGVAALL